MVCQQTRFEAEQVPPDRSRLGTADRCHVIEGHRAVGLVGEAVQGYAYPRGCPRQSRGVRLDALIDVDLA